MKQFWVDLCIFLLFDWAWRSGDSYVVLLVWFLSGHKYLLVF